MLVIGAGPTGLTAAWKLAEQGREVTIVDRAPAPGGMSASIDIAGQRVDFGSHRLHGKADPELLEELRGLLGDDLQARQRNGRIRIEGEWVGFPLRAGDLFANLPRSFAFGAATDSLTSSFRSPAANDFGSIVRAGLGSTVFDSFYGPYAQKLWGVDASELDGSLAQRRVSAGGPIDILKRLFAARKEDGRIFYYPRLGYGQICEALADAARSVGAEVRMNTSVDELFLMGEGATASVTGADGASEQIHSDLVISTMPATRLVQMVTPVADDEVVAAAKSLDYRAMLLVYLVVPRSQYTEFDAHYFPGLDTEIARLSEPKNYRTGPDPDGQTVLCAELACTVGDGLWEMGDGELGQLVAAKLAEQGLPAPEHTEAHVRRLSYVYPVYRHGYGEHLDVIERWAAKQPRLLTVGRQGLFVPDNLHHTVAMGRAVASVVADDGSFDRQAWGRFREDFRSHVVED